MSYLVLSIVREAKLKWCTYYTTIQTTTVRFQEETKRGWRQDLFGQVVLYSLAFIYHVAHSK